MKKLFFLWLMMTTALFAQENSEPPKVLAANGGRFAFGQIGPMRADQFLLDTQTGRLWRIVVDKEKGVLLSSVPYIMVNDKLSLAAPTEEQDIAALPQIELPPPPARPQQPEKK
jgi:hypothetical protein